MNGIGLLITIGFCTIVWWGTASYYKRIIINLDNQTRRVLTDLIAQNQVRDWERNR